jgi:hypothetical protein
MIVRYVIIVVHAQNACKKHASKYNEKWKVEVIQTQNTDALERLSIHARDIKKILQKDMSNMWNKLAWWEKVYGFLCLRSGRYSWFGGEGKARQAQDDIDVLFTQATMVRWLLMFCLLRLPL